MLGLRIISRRYGSGTQRSNLSEILPSDLYLPILNLGYSFWIYVATSLSLPINTEIRLIIFLAAKDGEALYSQQKQDQELTVAQTMNSLLPNSDLN